MSLPQITRCKIGLQPIAPYQKKTEPCPNCSKYFDVNFKQIDNTIQNLQEIIVNQNDVIMKALAEQKVLSERILYQEVTKKNLPSTFPLENINALNELNTTITEDNREAYINTMKSLLKGRLPKTLTEIMSINLCIFGCEKK